ncbi:NUDIX domain-containing protein [Aquicoccus sp.]|uniref:NUDIX domain-containing protein n=1 Tax=Aquicoccus sp. TaxID=2055851 RepID=UPI0035667248
MIRRIGAPPTRLRRHVLRRGVYAILPFGRDVLLTFQMAPFEELQLPGGGVEDGESPLHALHREVFEETGWKIASPRRLGAFRRFTYMPEYDLWAEKLCEVFIARPVRPLSDASEEDHVPVWMGADLAARELGNAGDRMFIARYLASR